MTFKTTDPERQALIIRVMQRMRQLVGKTMLVGELQKKLFEGEDLVGVKVKVLANKQTGNLVVKIGEDELKMVGSVKKRIEQ